MATALGLLGVPILYACTVDDGSVGSAPVAYPDATVVDHGLVGDAAAGPALGSGLQPFVPPPGAPAPNTILFTVSGGGAAVGGFPFPPAGADLVLVDGWQIEITRLLVTIGNITLANNPNKSPTDPSITDTPVAIVDGPFAVDLHRAGTMPASDRTDATAIPLTLLEGQNTGPFEAFDPAEHLAVSFDTVTATLAAQNVNLDAAAVADYRQMVDFGYAVLYVGRATFKGTSCSSPTPGYDFTKLPSVVDIKIGLASPTSYLNCQNPQNDPALALPNELHQRGIQPKANAFVVAQMTIQPGLLFGDRLGADGPLHFDPIAARFVGSSGLPPIATSASLVGVDFTAFRDAANKNLPWRSCVPTFVAPAGTIGFDARNVPTNPGAAPDQALRDYRDFVTYNTSTQGRLNGDGACAVRRNYASPR